MRKTYPPIMLKGGEVSELSADDGVVELHCEHHPDVVNFLAAYEDLRMLDEMIGVDAEANETRQYAARKVEQAWHTLPRSVFHAITDMKGAV